ncbi:MAG: FAD-dependent monooxygenase [Rhodoferax sp.]|nr:FAD-dependent monooxygenase [Rhodoferax sp.]MCW5643927.1 FAD-dependent monooxygenase [Rhodoferax sp.]
MRPSYMKIAIAGAGIGGLSAALSLHAAGFSDVTLFEAAREIQQVGVGINLPPHAVRELVELGLGEGLAAIGLPTAELCYYDRSGELIWAEARGTAAGYRWPQYSVHRGRLQHLLLAAVRERLGPATVSSGQRVEACSADEDGVSLTVTELASGTRTVHRADLLVGADGIRSAVRSALYGNAVSLATNGWVMYRGATPAASMRFLSGRSMVIVGDERQRVVAYPIDESTINWLMVRPLPTAGDAGTPLGNWNHEVAAQDIARYVQEWRFDWLDIHALVQSTKTVYEYPMADIDPLGQWSFGRITLLGDAAHAMYPFGSNGASQAIIDARVLAYQLAHHMSDPARALAAYDAARRESVAKVQLANRSQAGDVMARVSALARARAHGQARDELRSVEDTYKRLAGFDIETLNHRPSWSVQPAAAST